jgi:hypothetical protein
MGRYHLSTTHLWSEQQVIIDHRTFFHRQCQICDRDFVRALDEGEWRAVHVGGLRFDFLNEETTRRWVSEDCPGHPLPGEENHGLIRAGGLQASSKHRPGI